MKPKTNTVDNGVSAHLSPEEHTALKKYRQQFETEIQCAVSLQLDRMVLNRVLKSGSGKPLYIKRIQAVLKETTIREKTKIKH